MTFRLSAPVFALVAAGLMAGCDKPQPPAGQPPPQQAQVTAPQPQIDAAETIYLDGDIVTVNDKQPTAEALAVKGGKILAVGARADVEKAHKGAGTQVVDLGGKALLSGFMDAHSHYFSSLTVANQANVYAPPPDRARIPRASWRSW